MRDESKLFERLDDLGVPPELVLIGLEATSRYGENLFQVLLKRGYQVWHLASRAECMPLHNSGGCAPKRINSMPLPLHGRCESGEARFGYVPSEQIAAYRELMRVHHQRERRHRALQK